MITGKSAKALSKFLSANPDCAGLFIRGAREHVLKHRHTGLSCPACAKFNKSYQWSILRSQVTALLRLNACKPENEFHHLREWGDPSNKAGFLEFWGLIEPRASSTYPHSKVPGYWRLTTQGKSFLRGELKVPKYITVYLNQLEKVDDSEFIDVYDTFGETFDLKEMMQAIKAGNQ